MGTRATIRVFDEAGVLLTLYSQWDGYVKGGVGEALAKFLDGKTMVNGLSGNRQAVFNGPGCLAAALVANFKTEAGGYYIMRHNEAGSEDYNYELHVPSINDSGILDYGPIRVIVRDYSDAIFDGSVEHYVEWVKTND